MSTVGYLNGTFVDPERALIPIDERGHQFGDGVYEVLRVYSGRPFLPEWHFERLRRSLRAIGIENPHTDDEWMQLMNEGIRRSGEPESLVYLQVTRGIAPRGHLFPAAKPSVSMTIRAFQPAEPNPSASLLCLPDERWANVWIKTLNLLPNVIAKEIAHRAGANEALLVRSGWVTEGSSSNAWFVRDGVLWTAPANRYILGGVTRRFVLHLAQTLGLEVREQAIAVDDLGTVDEVFMTGTTTEIEPIACVKVDAAMRQALHELPADAEEVIVRAVERPVTVWEGPAPGPVTARLQDAFAQEIRRFRTFA
ncbi:aminotransferase class IV [Alicyclobacillus cycloheptanicus]|uniref:D-alanine transaminase n=1 Tax=Alicyclobacillus cycloheptanicus TaxID=1457 RepID=A0ABT9XF41_9BACL|nr:aminotransferase class IV [Alicyclobacillus cycloheptanicus]MDQ0188902.1 D-alanine transaminase [Alicyclobacillus cycloheptanicus]WDM01746.1 aminotransferase class IV [Alicyclobacillus cycloheptanicus]